MSPTTPCIPVGGTEVPNGERGQACPAQNKRLSPPIWADSSSEQSTKSPPAGRAVTNTRAPAKRAAANESSAHGDKSNANNAVTTSRRVGTPPGFYDLTFEETETQSPPAVDGTQSADAVNEVDDELSSQ